MKKQFCRYSILVTTVVILLMFLSTICIEFANISIL